MIYLLIFIALVLILNFLATVTLHIRMEKMENQPKYNVQLHHGARPIVIQEAAVSEALQRPQA